MAFINFGRNWIAIIFAQYLTLTSGLPWTARPSPTSSIPSPFRSWFWDGWQARSAVVWERYALLTGTVTAIAALLLLVLTTSVRSSTPVLFSGSWGCTHYGRRIHHRIHIDTAGEAGPVVRLVQWYFFLSFGLGGTLIAGPLVDGLISAGHPQSWAYQMSFAAAAGLTTIGLFIQAALFYYLKKPS